LSPSDRTARLPSAAGLAAPAGPPPAHRVCYVLKMYPRFSETFVVSEILAREARGGELEIVSLRPPADGRFHEALAAVRAPVTYLRRWSRAVELWELVQTATGRLPRLPALLPELALESAEDAAQALELALLVQDRGFTHLHAHFGSVATTVARLAARLAGVSYSFTAHAKDIFHESVDPTDLGRKLADAHHVVTVSDFNAAFLREQYAAAAARVVRVYNGLPLDAFAWSDPAGRPPVVAAVGRLVEKKGFPVLLDAVALLRAEGLEVRCVLAGAGALEGQLRAQVDRLRLTDAVTMPGAVPQSQVRRIVSGAAVLAAPCVTGADGNQDGLPTVLLEAMALGTPCVATDVTGIPEAVRHGKTGLIVAQHDAAGLAAALRSLLTDPARRTRLAVAARARVEREFDARAQARALDALLPGAETPAEVA
jgi:colanic acid/amylovoran biosynthesis glycosyltransferase